MTASSRKESSMNSGGQQMIRTRNHTNQAVLKEIISKSRRANLPLETQYLIIFAFVYKYCSDSLKDHLMFLLQDKEVTLDEAYDGLRYSEEFRIDSYHLYGFHIERADAFMDEVINTKFESETFFKDLFDAFDDNITFSDNYRDGTYITELLDAVREEFPFEMYDSKNENTKILKDIIYSISKLNVFESDFRFEDVFTALSDSRLLKVSTNPLYIYQILSAIIAVNHNGLEDVYDPFMRDGSSFWSLSLLSNNFRGNVYGKESDRITYFYTIARLFFSYYNLDSLYFQNEDATDSADINQASFDAILSVIPIKIRNYLTSSKNQSMEIVKRNKRAQLEDVLSKNFDMDLTSFAEDDELSRALENLINKMDVEKESESQFSGEYEVLRQSEFLFLINLINSLKSNGIMAVSISQNFLTKESLATLRKYLTVEKNYIDAIINIPNEFGRYKHPESVIIFRKNRNNSDVLFIDMTRDFETTRVPNVVPGLFRKNVLIATKDIEKMLDVLKSRNNVDKYSHLISQDEIASNDFNLSVSKYVDTFEGEFVNLSSLERERQEIDMKRQELDYKIDVMMKELNIK